MTEIVWLSLDPVRGSIDYYPRVFARKLEEAYQRGDDACVLGQDFFNATIHFAEMFQTTPGQHFARNYKVPGYRTVRRLEEGDPITLFAKRTHGEWRLCKEDESERTFTAPFPTHYATAAPSSNLRIWTAEDLSNEEAGDDALVVWQWRADNTEDARCEDGWYPYLEHHNRTIEDAYTAREPSASIRLGKRDIQVRFTPDSCFATQHFENKVRAVRRKIITSRELVQLIKKLWPTSNFAAENATEELLQNLRIEHAPSFLCPITQQIMEDPVMTDDGHSYERDAIEQWCARTARPLSIRMCAHPTCTQQAADQYDFSDDRQAPQNTQPSGKRATFGANQTVQDSDRHALTTGVECGRR